MDVETNYELADEQIITIANERFPCRKVLFQASLFDIELQSAYKLTCHVIVQCDVNTFDVTLLDQFRWYNEVSINGPRIVHRKCF